MPPKGLNGAADVDFETTWQVLEKAFYEIHTKNASVLSFEELYRNAYKIVLKKKGDELYKKVAKFEEDWLGQTVRPEITKLITAPLQLSDDQGGRSLATTAERRVAGERFLSKLKLSWEDHQVCMGMLTDVLMYMVSGMKERLCDAGVTNCRTRTACTVPIATSPRSSRNPWASSATKSCAPRFDRTTVSFSILLPQSFSIR